MRVRGVVVRNVRVEFISGICLFAIDLVRSNRCAAVDNIMRGLIVMCIRE